VAGTDGLLTLLAHSFVTEVQQFCQSVGRCTGWSKVNSDVRGGRITEFLQSLLPDFYPQSTVKSTDQRPLHNHYAQLVSACDPRFVGDLLCQDDHILLQNLPKGQVLKHHAHTLRRLVFDAINRAPSLSSTVAEGLLANHLSPLLQSMPPLSSIEPGISALMSFAEIVL